MTDTKELVAARLAEQEAEIARLRNLFKLEAKLNNKHVKKLNERHATERDIISRAAQGFRERAESAEAEIARLREALDLALCRLGPGRVWGLPRSIKRVCCHGVSPSRTW